MGNNWGESKDAFQYWYDKGGMSKVRLQMPAIFEKHPRLVYALWAAQAAIKNFEDLALELLPDHEVTDD